MSVITLIQNAHGRAAFSAGRQVVPDDVRDERDPKRDHRRPVKAGFAVERLDETVGEMPKVEWHGLRILPANPTTPQVMETHARTAFR
jgi:hypothetical protein